eukprot:scaffold10231_cov70-Skeletonema_marinoi.AAC.1
MARDTCAIGTQRTHVTICATSTSKHQLKHHEERGADYEEFKDQLAKHLLDILYETVPQVKGKVDY